MNDQDSIRTSGVIAGVAVIRGTRIPIATLVDYLRRGKTTADFLHDFPAVTEPQLTAVLIGGLEALVAQRARAARLEAPG